MSIGETPSQGIDVPNITLSEWADKVALIFGTGEEVSELDAFCAAYFGVPLWGGIGYKQFMAGVQGAKQRIDQLEEALERNRQLSIAAFNR